MSMEGLIGLIVMVIMGLIGVIIPFLTSRPTIMDNRKRQLELTRDELITSYERVLSTLRDLEDDYKSHKMHAEDYEQERAYWSQYGVRLLQLLDGKTDLVEVDDKAKPASEDDEEMHLDQSVEEAIHNYRVALQSVEKS